MIFMIKSMIFFHFTENKHTESINNKICKSTKICLPNKTYEHYSLIYTQKKTQNLNSENIISIFESFQNQNYLIFFNLLKNNILQQKRKYNLTFYYLRKSCVISKKAEPSINYFKIFNSQRVEYVF